MSPRRTKQDGAGLTARLDALARARDLADGRSDPEILARVDEVIARATARRALSTDHTVVGIFGPTGSGKSALLNAIAGQELARVGIRRPTTDQPLAAVWGADGSRELLDWLQVGDRRIVNTRGDLILLDLPDFDSTRGDNRAVAQRMTGMVDVLIWVMDPQKYADAVLHREFIQPFAAHGGVTLAVLNQIDRLPEADRSAVTESAHDLLVADGLTSVPVYPVSALTREGVSDLRRAITGVADARSASLDRLQADVASVAADLGEDARGEAGGFTKTDAQALTDALARAGRTDQIAAAAGASYRRRATGRTGWPLTRWIRHRKADPLERLHLGVEGSDTPDAALPRTSLPHAVGAEAALTQAAAREFAAAAGGAAAPVWRRSIRAAALSHEDEIPDALDQTIAGTDLGGRRVSWWWRLVNIVQWVALLSLVIGVAWVVGTLIARAAGMTVPDPAVIDVLGLDVSIPIVLAVVGFGAGIILALLSRAIANGLSRVAERHAARRLRDGVAGVAVRLVAEPTAAEVERYRKFREELRATR